MTGHYNRWKISNLDQSNEDVLPHMMGNNNADPRYWKIPFHDKVWHCYNSLLLSFLFIINEMSLFLNIQIIRLPLFIYQLPSSALCSALTGIFYQDTENAIYRFSTSVFYRLTENQIKWELACPNYLVDWTNYLRYFPLDFNTQFARYQIKPTSSSVNSKEKKRNKKRPWKWPFDSEK